MRAQLKRVARFCGHGWVKRCAACGRAVRGEELQGLCCRECRRDLRLRAGGYCPECGQIYARETEPPHRCMVCRAMRRPWDRFSFFQAYRGLFRDILLAYKLNGELGYSKLLQQFAVEAFEGRLGAEAPDMIVPVPIHTRRLVSRGFNQSIELSRALSGRLRAPIEPEALIRTRHTPTQTGLSPKERRRNLRGSVQAREDLVQGKTVLLVDDIYTTGATVGECARVLRKAGAGRVDVLVLARVADNW